MATLPKPTTGTGSTGGTASTQTQTLPQWVQGEGKGIFDSAKKYAASNWEKYPGQRTAGMSDSSKFAMNYFGNSLGKDATSTPLSWVASSANYRTPDLEAQQMQRPGGDAPSVGTERVVDETGRLGAIYDYMNPHTQNALQPAIQEIHEQGLRQRNDIGRGATMAGAFGDSRHGVVEGEQMRNEGRNVGELTYKGMNDAFNQAMQNRQSDLARMLGADTTNAQFLDKDRDRTMEESIRNTDLRQRTNEYNANLSENTLNRLLASADRWSNITDTDSDNKSKDASLLAALGQQEQATKQKGLDTEYQDWFDWIHQGRDDVNFLMSILNGVPYEKSTVQSSGQQQSNPAAGLFGSLLGAM